MDEFTALAHYRTNGLEVVITRLFNTVGPRQTGAYGMVIPSFVAQALKNEPITVFGDGTQTRTFTYVKEVVTALMKLMASDQAIGEVINVGGVEEISMLDLAQKIINMTGSTSAIQLIPYAEAFGKDFEDMQRRVPSTQKLEQVTGFAPDKSLDFILSKVIEYIKRR
jgi:UDP-glucose 4-epimerase